ncbi:anillin-like [Contarinia nasturtii]|uniref:anillin-like n=1 Tax=Contarinia nasturtii TaxID=265458 RepID=UPI0012D47EBE|nr:anillin-like [Contarinia nasturtii]
MSNDRKFGVANGNSKVPLKENNAKETPSRKNSMKSKMASSSLKRRQSTDCKTEYAVENVTPTSSCSRDSSQSQLYGLGVYPNPQNLSSHRNGVHRTEPAFAIKQSRNTRSGTKLKEELAQLANSFNEWEDETMTKRRSTKTNANNQSTATVVAATSKSNNVKSFSGIKSVTKSPRKRNEKGMTSSTPNRVELIQTKVLDLNNNSNGKKLDCNKRLEYDFVDETERVNRNVSNASAIYATVNKVAVPKQTVPEPTKKVEVTKGLVSNRAALFETSALRATNDATANEKKNEKDPAEISFKKRMEIFEQNKSGAMIPRSSISLAAPIKQIMAHKKPTETVKQAITTPQKPIDSVATSVTPQPSPASASKIDNYNKAIKAETIASGRGIRQTVAALLAAPATISESRIISETRKIREQEMHVVLNRCNERFCDDLPAVSQPKPTSPPPPQKMPAHSSEPKKRISDEHLGVSADVRRSLESVKRIKVNPPKNGHAYPSLTDIESSGAERMTPENYTPEPAIYTQKVNIQPIIHRYMYSSQDEGDEEWNSYMDSEDDDISLASTDFDNYIGEAINNLDDDLDEHNCTGNAVQNGTLPSNSFSYVAHKSSNRQHLTFKDEATTSHHGTKFQSPIKSRLMANPSDDYDSLTYTVDRYRRQQIQNSPNAEKMMNRMPILTPPMDEHTTTDDNTDFYEEIEKITQEYIRSQNDLVEHKIKLLQHNIDIQNQQITQSSNALNTCASMLEFSGSAESVVAEWKLLVATHSRKALSDEMERLENERVLRLPNATKERCRLTIKNIVLPLRDDYVKKVAEEEIVGHHLVCLLKYNEHVLATKTIPTLPGLRAVKFPGELHLDNVYADFKITLEIYGMIAQKECIPHEEKYHIHKGKKGVIKTPKGKKAGSCLIMPPIQLPANQNAVHAPAFASYGFTTIELREVQQNTWNLQETSPEITPLCGTVQMKINCAFTVNIDHRAFLTMFEDVSGFGAWHRRWCRLHGNILSYWKYPDDERLKPPIGSLDLSVCEQQQISTAPRDMCARLNTFMIELKRPRRADDKDSMLLRTQGKYSYVSHLLSADDKKERDEWCEYFNKTLLLMRAWGNSSK